MGEVERLAGRKLFVCPTATSSHEGKVAYIEIPALDANVSAAFYEAVFGFHVSPGTPDRVSFEDGPSHLIGAFTRQLSVSPNTGVLPWIYVESVTRALERIGQSGGQVGQPPRTEGDVLVATFRDPAGNLIGVWQFIQP